MKDESNTQGITLTEDMLSEEQLLMVRLIQAQRTPPTPASYGEPWPTIYLDESIGCFGDVRRQDTDEQYIHIQPVGPGGSKERNDQRQAIGQRVADTWNACQGIADPVEALKEVRAALDLFGKIFALQKPAPIGGWNWGQLASQSNNILAKLNL